MSHASFRTETGGRLDRTRTVRFTFDGVTYRGFAGDTLASALLANGVHLVGRSFKYHRPRGIVTAGSEEPDWQLTARANRTVPVGDDVVLLGYLSQRAPEALTAPWSGLGVSAP